MLRASFKQKSFPPRVCKLVAIVLLAAGCSPKREDVVAAVASPAIFQVENPGTKGRKFEMSLTLETPEDLKVKQGDKVVAGQIVAERKPTEQQRLSRIQLVSQIDAIAHPAEEFHLIQANQEVELALAMLKNYDDSSPYTAAAPIPMSRLVKHQELEAGLAAAANKRNAIAAQLEVARQEIRFKKDQLTLQLKVIDAEAEQLKIKSPYTGTIRRVKVERGSNRQLTVTLVIQSKDVIW